MTNTCFPRITVHFHFIVLYLLIAVLIGIGICWSGQVTKPKVAVIVSREIKPYMEAMEGLKLVLVHEAGGEIKNFPLEDYSKTDLDLLKKELKNGKFNLAISVGPEATSFLWSGKDDLDLLRVFTMVLSPEELLPQPQKACGISLSIPIKRQLKTVAESLPYINRLGLLFNPKYNHDFYQLSCKQAQLYDLKIKPLKIHSQKDIPETLEKSWPKIDGLWLIPDKTVISKSVVEYIIKEALYQKKPVIGYNRFFYESGAAMAFVLDYRIIGKQTGRLALNKLREQSCQEKIPAFQVKVNSEVLESMGYEGHQAEKKKEKLIWKRYKKTTP